MPTTVFELDNFKFFGLEISDYGEVLAKYGEADGFIPLSRSTCLRTELEVHEWIEGCDEVLSEEPEHRRVLKNRQAFQVGFDAIREYKASHNIPFDVADSELAPTTPNSLESEMSPGLAMLSKTGGAVVLGGLNLLSRLTSPSQRATTGPEVNQTVLQPSSPMTKQSSLPRTPDRKGVAGWFENASKWRIKFFEIVVDHDSRGPVVYAHVTTKKGIGDPTANLEVEERDLHRYLGWDLTPESRREVERAWRDLRAKKAELGLPFDVDDSADQPTPRDQGQATTPPPQVDAASRLEGVGTATVAEPPRQEKRTDMAEFLELLKEHFDSRKGKYGHPDVCKRLGVWCKGNFIPQNRHKSYREIGRSFRSFQHPDKAASMPFTRDELEELFKYFSPILEAELRKH